MRTYSIASGKGAIRGCAIIRRPVPAPLEAIVMQAMAARRDERFASCRELRAALADYALLHGFALSVDELGDFVRTLVTRGLATTPTAAPTLSGRKWRPPALAPQTETRAGKIRTTHSKIGCRCGPLTSVATGPERRDWAGRFGPGRRYRGPRQYRAAKAPEARPGAAAARRPPATTGHCGRSSEPAAARGWPS